MIFRRIYNRLYSLYFNGGLLVKKIYNSNFGYYVARNDFPYDLMEPMPPGSEKVMKKCCEALEEAGITYWLSSGTALAVYRDGKFFAHDPDVDVDILGPVDKKMIHEIFTKKLKMTLGSEIVYRKKPQQLVYYTKDFITFDMHFWETKGEWVYNYSLSDSIWRHPKSFYQKFIPIKFRGKRYPIPEKIEEYLKYMYGKGWSIPQTKKTSFLGGRKDIFSKDLK